MYRYARIGQMSPEVLHYLAKKAKRLAARAIEFDRWLTQSSRIQLVAEIPLSQPRPKRQVTADENARPVEHLLAINQRILRARMLLSRALLIRRLIWLGVFVIPGAIVYLIVLAARSSQDANDKGVSIFFLSVAIAAVIGFGIYFIYFRTSKDHPAELRLNLQQVLEEKRIRSAELTLDVDFRRSSYRDELPEVIAGFRRGSLFYRRVHNSLQTVIIVGSLGTSTLTSLSVETGQFRIVAVVSSLAVGAAAGFTGYFKFRERGFYLQQTADAIEQQWQAFELGIGRYSGAPVGALGEFVSEVERLRAEQQQRAQNLDQPSEKSGAQGNP